jgi:hypothetical protein
MADEMCASVLMSQEADSLGGYTVEVGVLTVQLGRQG